MDCNCSGVVGAAEAPARDAWIAWKNWINAKGGIDGHPVQLLYADDNNSAQQDIQNVRNFVENGHAIALVNLFAASGALPPVAKYAESKHVAVVGGSGYDAEWTEYPSMFSTATADPAQDYAWAAEMKNGGAKVVGTAYCAEASVCTSKEALWKQAAQKLGLTVKGEFKESLANPNYGPDCAQWRSDGVTSVVPIEDGASSSRVARDCAQQGYHPLLIVPQPFNNPPSTMEGAVAPLGSFPWFLTSGSPALAEYGAALAKYDHNECNSYCSLGWANAKLLEKALTGRVSAVPKASDVLQGLWALHNETLGGLTPPMTFHQGKNADPVTCAFRAVVKSGKWVAPVGMTPVDCTS
jgi:branched-chain amino acid transport system substrate-binding protein